MRACTPFCAAFFLQVLQLLKLSYNSVLYVGWLVAGGMSRVSDPAAATAGVTWSRGVCVGVQGCALFADLCAWIGLCV
jgi:hypothetical protein